MYWHLIVQSINRHNANEKVNEKDIFFLKFTWSLMIFHIYNFTDFTPLFTMDVGIFSEHFESSPPFSQHQYNYTMGYTYMQTLTGRLFLLLLKNQ